MQQGRVTLDADHNEQTAILLRNLADVALEVDGERVFFKVDYYDPELERHSDDPSDPEITRRVLTIGLASDY